MDRFDDLRTFVAVVEAGSFTAAADRLEVAKSAVSRRVSALEERLGAQLLRRTTRRLNLTTSGAGFFERARRVLADLDEAEAAASQEHGELRGQVRVALPLSFGVRHMHRPICAFGALHPKLQFDLDLNDRRVDLIEEGIDVAVRIGQLADSTLIARKLFDARTVVVASPDYLTQHGTPRSPQDLLEHVCLRYTNVPDPGRWVFGDANGKADSVRVGGGMDASSGDFLCDAAAAGLGIALQPRFIAHHLIEAGRLVSLLTEYRWPITPGFAVYPPTRHLSYRVRSFIDFLVEYFSGPLPWERSVPSGK